MTRRIIQLNVAYNYYSTDGLRANTMVFTIKCELNEKANKVSGKCIVRNANLLYACLG